MPNYDEAGSGEPEEDLVRSPEADAADPEYLVGEEEDEDSDIFGLNNIKNSSAVSKRIKQNDGYAVLVKDSHSGSVLLDGKAIAAFK